jgi:hypothetical protein
MGGDLKEVYVMGDVPSGLAFAASSSSGSTLVSLSHFDHLSE